jgi:hypothetical protein
MGQYKFSITYRFTVISFGFIYEKNFAFCVYFLWFKFCVGLTQGASGFGVWKDEGVM